MLSAHLLWLSFGLELSPAWWTSELITICVHGHWLWLSSGLELSPAWWTSELITICVHGHWLWLSSGLVLSPAWWTSELITICVHGHWLWLSSGLKFSPAWWTSELITICVHGHWLWLSSGLELSPAWWTSELITICVHVHWLWLSSGLELSRAWWPSELITICVYIGCDSSGLMFSPAWWPSELITICVYISCDGLLFLNSHLRDGHQNSLQYVCTPAVNVLGDVWGTALTCVMNVIRTLYCVHTRRPNETKLIWYVWTLAVIVFCPWILTCVMDVRTHYDMCVHWLWLSFVLKFLTWVMDVSSLRYVCTPFFLPRVVMSSELFTVYVHRRRPLSPVLKCRNLLRNSYISLSSQALCFLSRVRWCQSSVLCLYTGCVLWGFAFICENNYECSLGLCFHLW